MACCTEAACITLPYPAELLPALSISCHHCTLLPCLSCPATLDGNDACIREDQKVQQDKQLCAFSLTGKCHVHGVDNVGTVPAAVVAYLAVHEFAPDLVISVGTAGGFAARGAKIGEVFLATGFANHDRRIPIPVRLYSFQSSYNPALF